MFQQQGKSAGCSLSPVKVVTAVIMAMALLVSACTSGSESDPKAGAGSTTSAPAGASDGSKAGPLARYADHKSKVYEDPASWLCRPEANDICDSELDATVVQADGRLTVEKWKADPDAPIDCFYVYPTISRDVASFSDMEASDDEEGFVALNQVARLGQECRVFAPIYRQRTLAGLSNLLGGASAEDPTTTTAPGADKPTGPNDQTPLNDVLDAFKTYMARDNNGRGVVLIGHSQGAALLTQLVQSEFDPNSDVRDLLVAAYLAGWSVRVPEGKDVGGDFKNVALCRDKTQTGCVATWSSYRVTSLPPADAIFGSSSVDASGDKLVAGCNSPADLTGAAAEAKSYFPADASESILGALGVPGASSNAWIDPLLGTITTRFVTTPGLVTVQCASANGINYQSITINSDPDDPRADDIGGELSPQWGMHLQDVNVVMGNIVDLVGSQSKAYLKG